MDQDSFDTRFMLFVVVVVFALLAWGIWLDGIGSDFLRDHVFELHYWPWISGVALSALAIVGLAVRRRLEPQLAITDLHDLVTTWSTYQAHHPGSGPLFTKQGWDPYRRDWSHDYREIATRLRAVELVRREQRFERLLNRMIGGAHAALRPCCWVSGFWLWFWIAEEADKSSWSPATLVWALATLPFIGLWGWLVDCLGGYETFDSPRNHCVTVMSAARRHQRNSGPVDSGFLPAPLHKKTLSATTIEQLQQVSFSGAEPFDKLVWLAKEYLYLSTAQLFVFAYDKQLTLDFESPAQIEALWNEVLKEVLSEEPDAPSG